MPFAPLLKCKSTGRSSASRRSSITGCLTTPNGHTSSKTFTYPTCVGCERLASSSHQNTRKPHSGITESPMGKKYRPVSNGVTKQNGKSKSKYNDRTSIPQSVKLVSMVIVVIAVVIFLVIQTDTLSYFFGNNQNDSSWQTTPKTPPAQKPTDSAKTKTKVITKGGWRKADQNILDKYGSDRCTIDRRRFDTITVEEFERVYRYKRPVIVTFPNGAKSWTNPEKWTVKNLKQEYGAWRVLSGNSREIVRRGGNGDVESSFSEFVDSIMKDQDSLGEPFYVFDRGFYNDSSLPKTLKPPKYLKIQDGVDDSIFFLGASSSGVSFHKHADAWNGVIFGRKRWFLYPINQTPPGGVYPGFTQIEWYKYVYPLLDDAHRPMECVQEAGEILYLPESTYHGTINLGDTVAIGIQKKQANTPAEKLFYEELMMGGQVGAASPEEQHRLRNRKVKIFEELSKFLPENSEVYMKLGGAYSDIGKDDLGLKYTQKAIDIDPNFVIAYINKGKTLSRLNRLKEAEETFKVALKLNPNMWDVLAQYGDFLLHHGRPAEAVQYFKKGTVLQPAMQPFWSHLQMAQEQSGDMDGAKITAARLEKLRQEELRH